MANRFGQQYRPPHDGQNVYGSDWLSQDWIIPNHPDALPRYDPFRIVGDPNTTFNPYEDGFGEPSGGAKVPRKPKPQSPSGGMTLPLLPKVSL